MKKISIFSIGLLTGIVITVSGVAGAATYLKATPKAVTIDVDGKKASISAMNVENKLYIPVRDAAASFGYSVSSVTSSAVAFTEGKTVTTNSVGTGAGTVNTTTTGGQYVENLHGKYSTDGKLDAAKVKAGIAAGEITVNSQDKETGNSLLHYVVLEDNFAVYSIIKVNALNVNLQNNDGRTPLHLAVINERIFYLGELKDYKADPTIKDNAGKRPIDYADPKSTTYDSLFAYML
jgi:FOG: Ankyrin repeat